LDSWANRVAIRRRGTVRWRGATFSAGSLAVGGACPSPGDERRDRHRRHDERRRAGRQAPALDQHDHEQKQRRRQRGRDERERRERGHLTHTVLTSGRRTTFGQDGGARGHRADRAGQGEQGDRRLQGEHRLPRERLGQKAAGGGADGPAEHARRRPQADRSAPRGAAQQQRQRGGHDDRASDPLRRARGDQDVERRRGGACQRGRREAGDRDDVGEPPAGAQRAAGRAGAAAHEPGRADRGQREREVERDQHPRDRGDAGVELAQDRRQRQRHDRRVRQHDPHRQREQQRRPERDTGLAASGAAGHQRG
jgi:hypothetical protein